MTKKQRELIESAAKLVAAQCGENPGTARKGIETILNTPELLGEIDVVFGMPIEQLIQGLNDLGMMDREFFITNPFD